MPKPDGTPTLDERVRSGLKVMATGATALDMTPNQADAAGWLFRVSCRCGHQGSLSNKQLIARGRGDIPIRRFADRLACPTRTCKGPKVIELIDPSRAALD